MTILRSFIIVATGLLLASCGSEDDGWIRQIGGVNNDTVFGITATDDGRVCVTGTFISVVDFGNEDHPIKLDSGGYSDIYVACYADDGTPVFATHFGVTQKNDQPRAIAALPGGDVLVTGFFSKTFGKEPDQVLQAWGSANGEIFLARVDRTGSTVWAHRYGGSMSDTGRALAVDADSNILLAGTFQGVMPYIEDGVGKKMTSAGSLDAFLFKLNSDGEILWGRQFGGMRRDELFAVTTTTDGKIVVAGTFADKVSVDEETTLEAVGYNDVFIQAWSSNGDLLWTRAFGGGGQEYIGGLAAGDNGSVWLTGSFQREIVFSNGDKLVSQGSTDGFLVGIDASGNLDQSLSFGGKDVELVYGIGILADGSIALTGHFQNESDLDPGTGKVLYRSSGTNDTEGFVLMLDHNGQHRSAVVLAGDDVAVGNGIAPMPGGGIAVTGIFGKTMQVKGSGALSLTSQGKSDVFVIKVSAD